MRCWITILLVLFGAAVAHAGVEKSPVKLVPAACAVLSQAEEHTAEVEAPLFATAFSAGSSRLCGSETMPVRIRSHFPAWISCGHRALVRSVVLPAAPHRDAVAVLAGASRPADRYVYALRRIII